MQTVALIVRLLIAVIFFVAGIAKLADLQGTRKGVQDFGVPEWAASSLGILLPLAELAVAVLLIPLSTMLWGSVGTIVLLLIFITGIGINLAQGRKPSCNCFGQVHSEPVGWSTLIRNCVLSGAAGFVLWQGGHGSPLSVVGWTTGISNAETVAILLGASAVLLIAAQGWFTFHLLQQNGRLVLRMDALETQLSGSGVASVPAGAPTGLPIGSPGPAFALPALFDGSILTLDILRAGRRPVVLIFSDPDCGPCSALLPDIARWEQEQAATLTIALISRGSKEANRAKIGEHRLRHVLLQKDREVAVAYRVNGTPGAVLIGIDGKIASFVAMGSQAIAGLITIGAGTSPAASVPTNGKPRSASHLLAGPVDLKIGHAAPPLGLPDLSGKIIDLSVFMGRETLVLFWNPNCGFCAKMLPDLKRWEEDRPAKAPQLLVVSSGTAEANRAMGLRAPVVLDQTFASGVAFHVRGTPAAVLVDANGKIASGVASGAPAVFALANAQHRISV
jgi:thiol-disulfide isomerase/thioredoxin